MKNNYKKQPDYIRLLDIENELIEHEEYKPHKIQELEEEQCDIVFKRYKEYCDNMLTLYNNYSNKYGELFDLLSFNIRCGVNEDLEHSEGLSYVAIEKIEDSDDDYWCSFNIKDEAFSVSTDLETLFDKDEQRKVFEKFCYDKLKESKQDIKVVENRLHEMKIKYDNLNRMLFEEQFECYE